MSVSLEGLLKTLLDIAREENRAIKENPEGLEAIVARREDVFRQIQDFGSTDPMAFKHIVEEIGRVDVDTRACIAKAMADTREGLETLRVSRKYEGLHREATFLDEKR